MIKECVCSFCGMKFNYDSYGDDFERRCFKHEVLEHLNGDKKCESIIKDVVNELNEKYGVSFSVLDYNFNPYYDDYDGLVKNEIEISFELRGTSDIFIRLTVTCISNTINLTRDMILKELEKYYILESEKRITGVVEFEDWCGGHGADDYIINGMYIRDIMKRLEGKKISIQILED